MVKCIFSKRVSCSNIRHHGFTCRKLNTQILSSKDLDDLKFSIVQHDLSWKISDLLEVFHRMHNMVDKSESIIAREKTPLRFPKTILIHSLYGLDVFFYM